MRAFRAAQAQDICRNSEASWIRGSIRRNAGMRSSSVLRSSVGFRRRCHRSRRKRRAILEAQDGLRFGVRRIGMERLTLRMSDDTGAERSLVVPGVELTLPSTNRASEFMLERPVAEDNRAAPSASRWFDCRASRAPVVRGSSSGWTRGIRYYVAEGTLRLDEVGKLHNVVDRISEGKSSGRCARSFGASDPVGRR